MDEQFILQKFMQPNDWIEKEEFKEENNVLIVGDGDLSFSLSFSKLFCQTENINKLIATTYDCYPKLLHKYPHIVDIISELEDNEKTEIYFGVDATDLQATLPNRSLTFSKIIWNFPHAGGKNFIKKNRTLVREFFRSAEGLLNNDLKSSIYVSLVCGQGGTDFEELHVPKIVKKNSNKLLKRSYADHWQALEQGGNSNFLLNKIKFFQAPNEIYRPRGYRDNLTCAKSGFATNYSVTHIFKRAFPPFSPIPLPNYCQIQLVELFSEVSTFLISRIQNFILDKNQNTKIRAIVNKSDLPSAIEANQVFILKEKILKSDFILPILEIPELLHSIKFIFDEKTSTDFKNEIEILILQLSALQVSENADENLHIHWEPNPHNQYQEICIVTQSIRSVEHENDSGPFSFNFCYLSSLENSNLFQITIFIEEYLMFLFKISNFRWFYSKDPRFQLQILNLWENFKRKVFTGAELDEVVKENLNTLQELQENLRIEHHNILPDNYLQLEHENQLDFHNFCLFTPCFEFNVSFWLPEGKLEVTTEEIIDVVQHFEYKMFIKSFKFLNKFHRYETDSHSETYSVIYQKIDAPLHRDQANAVHQLLANFIGQKLNVTIR